jgi:hypothetical protein
MDCETLMIWILFASSAHASPFLDTRLPIDPNELANWKKGHEAYYDCPILCGMRASLKQRVLQVNKDSLILEERFKCTPAEETRTYHIDRPTGQVTLIGKVAHMPVYLSTLTSRSPTQPSILLSAPPPRVQKATLEMKPFSTCYGWHELLYREGTLK